MPHENNYREACLDEKGESCTICEADEEIVIHHLDGDRANNDLDNLEPVCSSCHGKIHSPGMELKEWTEKLLPSHERKRTVSITMSPEEQKYFQVIQNAGDFNSIQEAIIHAGRSRVEAIERNRVIMQLLEEARGDGTEADAELIEKALKYLLKMESDSGPVGELLEKTNKNGSLPPGDIAEILSTKELPIVYRWAYTINGKQREISRGDQG